MKPDLQTVIDQANKRTQADRNKQFVKRSSDQQMLEHLTKSARIAVDAYFSNARDCDEAMKDLRKFVALSERRAR